MPTIQGTVTDPDGNPVSDESVYIEREGSVTFAELTTDGSGNYSYNANSNTTYTMRIENPDLEAETETLREENKQLRARNAELETRLDRIEDSLDIDAGTETGTTED